MSSQVILSGLVLAVHTRVLEREERKESLDGHGPPEPERFLNHGPVSASSRVVHTVMSVEPILQAGTRFPDFGAEGTGSPSLPYDT